MASSDELENLVSDVLRGRKYRNVSDVVIRNIGRSELRRGVGYKECVKSTKNKLHQITGMYLAGEARYSKWLEEIGPIAKSGSLSELKSVCMKLMKFHPSTRERIPVLDRFYADVFSRLDDWHVITDLGCGLNPLSLPWFPGFRDIEYHAYDLDKSLITFLNEFFELIGLDAYAEVRDVIFDAPTLPAGLSFMLKLLPLVDQIDRAKASALLEKSPSRNIVVSFPVRSLGGREKSMVKHYGIRMKKLIECKGWASERMEFDEELVYFIKKW